MLTREVSDFRRNVIKELRGIRAALERLADAASKNGGDEKENDHREE